MNVSAKNLRGRLLLFTAVCFAGGTGFTIAARAQTSTASAPVVVPGDGTPAGETPYEIQKVRIHYQKLLLKEKDIPNAVTELGQKDIQATNPVTGSIQTLLNRAPNVVAYSQQSGQDGTTLAIRGVRNDELAETLDGVPINDLLDGSGDYNENAIGSPVTLNEIDGVTIYPGIAPPDHQGFGTTGGTIAYTTKQPTDDRSAEIEGGFGSFDTQHIGFTLNTGLMGDGPDAPKAMLLYDQSQTAGYVDDTKAQFHDFMFNLEKPFDNGLTKTHLVIIFNQGKGLVESEPLPTSLQQQYGYKFNFPTNLGFDQEGAQFLTVIASDDSYINKYMVFHGSLFFRHNSSTIDDYESPEGAADTQGDVNVQGTYPFFGCVGPNTLTYAPGEFTYDPVAAFGSCAAGESDLFSRSHDNTEGITPKLVIVPNDYNTITIGGLLAKSSYASAGYLYGGDAADKVEINGYNSFSLGGNEQRTIFNAYVQDKIELMGGKLQLLPGVRVDAAYSSRIQQTVYGIYEPAKLQNFTKIGEYYFGLAYNLPHNFVLFGSAGKGSLFSPVENYAKSESPTGITLPGTDAPVPEIVHLFEGGIRYDTPKLYLSLDYYYQAIANGFATYENFATGATFNSNDGGYLFRGLEAAGQYQITPALSVYANGSYNKTEYTKSFFAAVTLTQDQSGFASSGTPLSNVPQWDGNIGADYTYGPFTANLSGQYTGEEDETYDLYAPPTEPTATTPANPYNGDTVTDVNRQNPANFVVNLLLTYKIPVHYSALQSLTLSLNMENLFDERYYTYAFNSENPTTDPSNGLGGIYDPTLPGGAPYDSGFIGEPRSLTVNLTAKF